MKKAYSYLRFSTPEQSRGDSYRRQADAAQRYAEQYGLALDTELTFRDFGVSAFKGRNVSHGSLADFRRAVEAGVVKKGSFLLVESFDRITRMDPWDALPVFQEIINNGITIVTLQDGREWSREGLRENKFRILESLLVMMRAHEESATKSRRVRAARDAARAAVRAGNRRILTSGCPAWLRVKRDRDGFELIKERAEIVRRIFRMAAKGDGQHAIATTLNTERVRTWGGAGRKAAKHWHRSYIAKILGNPAVVGTLVPHSTEEIDGRKRRKALKPITKYYPPVVTKALWSSVRAIADSVSPLRGRHAKSGVVRNVLGGLAKCSTCGGSMTRVSKGPSSKAGKPYLVCDRAKSGAGCKYRAARLDEIETRLRQDGAEIVADAPPPRASGALDATIEGFALRMSEARRQIENILSATRQGGGSATLNEELRKLETEFESMKKEHDQLLERRERAFGPLLDHRLVSLQNALAADPFDIATANVRLREALEAVVVDPDTKSLDLYWKHGGFSTHSYGWPASLTTKAKKRKSVSKLKR